MIAVTKAVSEYITPTCIISSTHIKSHHIHITFFSHYITFTFTSAIYAHSVRNRNGFRRFASSAVQLLLFVFACVKCECVTSSRIVEKVIELELLVVGGQTRRKRKRAPLWFGFVAVEGSIRGKHTANTSSEDVTTE